MVDLNQTIPKVLCDASQRWSDKVVLQDDREKISFSALEKQARQVAQALIAKGLQKGERFAIWAPNINEWVKVALGGMMAGGVLVPLNTRYRGIEAGDILTRSKSRWLFTVTGFLDTDYPALLHKHTPESLNEIILMRGTSDNYPDLESFLAAGNDVSPERVDQRMHDLHGDDLSDIMYTSGTTGAPKGVMSSHGQVIAIFRAWSEAVGLTESDRYLIVNPFFHTFGYKSGWLTCLLTGATAYPEAIFDPERILATIEEQNISMLPGAPTIFQSILASEKLPATDLSSLRCAVTGAASVPEQLVRDMKEVLGFTNVYTGYGLTECGVVSICRDGDDFETIANTAGKAIKGIAVKVVDAQGHELPASEVGSIKVKGFNVMKGYLDDDAATADAIDQDGWLDTGDIGWKNAEGYIKITDRAKDMFISGGFNCYPAEIENLMLLHPDIVDVAVVGLADERLGEVGHAFIVKVENSNLEETELRAWCREHMANYKVPKRFTNISELPRNASGKVQKFLLDA